MLWWWLTPGVSCIVNESGHSTLGCVIDLAFAYGVFYFAVLWAMMVQQALLVEEPSDQMSVSGDRLQAASTFVTYTRRKRESCLLCNCILICDSLHLVCLLSDVVLQCLEMPLVPSLCLLSVARAFDRRCTFAVSSASSWFFHLWLIQKSSEPFVKKQFVRKEKLKPYVKRLNKGQFFYIWATLYCSSFSGGESNPLLCNGMTMKKMLFMLLSEHTDFIGCQVKAFTKYILCFVNCLIIQR